MKEQIIEEKTVETDCNLGKKNASAAMLIDNFGCNICTTLVLAHSVRLNHRQIAINT